MRDLQATIRPLVGAGEAFEGKVEADGTRWLLVIGPWDVVAVALAEFFKGWQR